MLDYLLKALHLKHRPSLKHKRKGFQELQWISKPKESRLLTLKDAAKWLGLTEWAMRERCYNGDIPVVRFPEGRKIYIDTLDLEAFIERNKERLNT